VVQAWAGTDSSRKRESGLDRTTGNKKVTRRCFEETTTYRRVTKAALFSTAVERVKNFKQRRENTTHPRPSA